jgi:hypothetical protein
MQFDREASQTRDYCVAKIATQRAARPDSSLRKERLFGMTMKLHPYQLSIERQDFRVSILIRAKLLLRLEHETH